MSVDLIKGFLDGLKPEPRLSVAEWADKFRYLSPVSSSEHGLWNTARTPYLREIMEKLSATDPCSEVIFMAGAQLGKTEMGFNWIGYIIDIAPGPLMVVQETEEKVKTASKTRLDPMIEATPRLSERIKPARSRDSGNTLLQKDFRGGMLLLKGANSSSGLSSQPIRYLMLDEVDRYPNDLNGEGSPLDLAKRRTANFARRKIYITSTPTTDGTSPIQAEFDNTDKRYYFIPCPDCGAFQRLKWSQLKWTANQPETVRYTCEHCAFPIEERHKPQMLAHGEWRVTDPDKVTPRKVGYHLSSLYSPFGWYSWQQAVIDWEDAQGKTEKLKTFINTVLGEVWKEKGERPEWENIYNKREQYRMNKPPKDVVFLTCGADVQPNRIECEIVGWCREKRSYSVDYRVFYGDTADKAVWGELRKVVHEVWLREDGLELPLSMMAVDSGHNTQHVYDFCRGFDHTKVIPIKGQDKQAVIVVPPKLMDVTKSGKKVGDIRVWHVGVSIVKDELYSLLRLNKNEEGEAPYGYCHFPEYHVEYFKGLTAEQKEFKIDKRGFRRYEWAKKYERNEPLDCRVYARAAATVVGMDRWEPDNWDAYEREITGGEEEVIPKKSSSFWK